MSTTSQPDRGSSKAIRSWWGWGTVDAALTDTECRSYGALIPGLSDEPALIPSLDDLDLRTPRIVVPAPLQSITSTEAYDRAGHAYGKAYRDVVRSLACDIPNPPDVVMFARTEADVVAVLDWATDVGVVVVPYGGGSSVVGGVEYRGDDRPWVSLDTTGMDRVVEIDQTSLAARIEGGALGPVIENQLRKQGFTLRHFPQSFEFSTLGGWLATRSGGHYATGRTHIDDFVESIRAVTPIGIAESWRLPGSGAGPSPDRLMLGSEGILGVITEAWMRVQRRPDHRASASVRFVDRAAAFAAVREISQSGYWPANCRLLDPGEAALSGAGDGSKWVLVLGVESAHHPVRGELQPLVEIALDHGGTTDNPANANASAGAGGGHAERSAERSHATNSGEAGRNGGGDDAAEAWKSAFLRMPYLRDAMARMGAVVETFETAITWDRIDELFVAIIERLSAAVTEVTGAPGLLNCRFTNIYPDGAAPYFTVIAAGRPGTQVAMWDEIKAASMEVLGDLGATVTHHHAVGRDHRPGYDRQRPDAFAAVLDAAKSTLDPAGVLNPGVLIR